MRKKILLVIGTAFLIKAIFDKQIGIDEGWGRGRVFFLTMGLVCIFAVLFALLFQQKYEKLKKYVLASVNRHISKAAQTFLIFLATTVAVIFVYVWLAQPFARDTQNSYNYYSEQAIAFKNGNLHLAEKPSSKLLSLGNPYDYILRKQANIEDFPWDVSLYKDKFYMYWGPVPSLLLAIFSRKFLAQLDDQYIALAFACGLFLYTMLIVVACWNTRRQRIPVWMPWTCLLAVAFATPITVMLKDSRIYEASIFGCQFFFIGGCYWIYSAANENQLTWWKLALGSIHWALAAGTRITIAPVILFTSLATLIYFFKTSRGGSLKLHLNIMAALGIPLLLATAGLGWYNWARFGSILEFGVKYQLTNVDYNVFKMSFSERYIQENLYNYLVHPFKLSTRFPFITRVEYLPSNDRMSGFIYLTPYVLLLAVVPLIRFFNNIKKTNLSFQEQETREIPGNSGNWLINIFTGSTLISMTLILSFYFVTMRYIADFMPSLVLLTTLQLGQEFRRANRTNISWRILPGITVVLAIFTIAANILVAIPQSGVVYAVDLINSFSKLAGFK